MAHTNTITLPDSLSENGTALKSLPELYPISKQASIMSKTHLISINSFTLNFAIACYFSG